MKIVTCIPNPDQIGYIHTLKASCKFYNLELTTLFIDQDYDTHRLKTKYLRQYLDTVDPEEIIFFTDGYDVIFV